MSSPDAHATLVAAHGATLCHLALDAIDHGLVHREPISVDLSTLTPLLREPRASFVTLTRQGEIRGLAGTPSAVKALAEDVIQNAYSAAFRDPKHGVLMARERVDLSVSVTVLSPTAPLSSQTEEELISSLRPGVDGLLISDGRCRALCLPAQWREYPEPRAFVEHLKGKAGMAKAHWSPSFSAWRFTAASVTLTPDGAVTSTPE